MNVISKSSQEWSPDGQAPTGPTPVALRAPSVGPVEKGKKQYAKQSAQSLTKLKNGPKHGVHLKIQ